MKQTYLYVVIMILCWTALVPVASASHLMTAYSLRVTVVEQGVTYEYEYDNPNHYEYEYGDTVIRGDQAKNKVTTFIQTIELQEDAEIEDMVNKVKTIYPEVEKVDIRYMNEDNKLFTWIWHDR